MMNQLNILHIFIAIFLLAIHIGNSNTIKQYNGYTVLRLMPTSMDQLKQLIDLMQSYDHLDFWTFPIKLNDTVDVMIPPIEKIDFMQFLAINQIKSTIMIEDVQSVLSAQLNKSSVKTVDFFDDYKNLNEIFNLIDSIASENSDIASVENIGTSTESRDIRIIKIGINQRPEKAAIWIEGGVNGREWISPATVCFIIKSLIDGYTNNNADIVKLLQQFDWHILPVVNPDGYEYSIEKDRLWKKTRSIPSGTNSTCIGVDPKRNYGFHWKEVGASNNPCSEIYAGPDPYSEPEVKAVSDYIRNLNGNRRFKAHLQLHSYMQSWMYPWGYSSQPIPDRDDLRAKAINAVAALTSHYGTKYIIGSNVEVVYLSSGSARDWAYGEENIKYSYSIGLRDLGYYGYLLPKDQIRPSGIETTTGVLTLAKEVAEEFSL